MGEHGLLHKIASLFGHHRFIPPSPEEKARQESIFEALSPGAQIAFQEHIRIHKEGIILPSHKSKTAQEKLFALYYRKALQEYSLADRIIDYNESKGLYVMADHHILWADETEGGLVERTKDKRFLIDKRPEYLNSKVDTYTLFPALFSIIKGRARIEGLEDLLTSDEFYTAGSGNGAVMGQTIFLQNKIAEAKGKSPFNT